MLVKSLGLLTLKNCGLIKWESRGSNVASEGVIVICKSRVHDAEIINCQLLLHGSDVILRENLAFSLFGVAVLIVILNVKEIRSYAEGRGVLIIIFWRRVKGDSCLICWTIIKKSY